MQLAFATPKVFRARTPREMQAIVGSASAVPSADRAFSRTERVVVKIDTYGPGGEKPAVTARLLNRLGTSMSDVPVQTAASGETHVELTLSSFAVGEYILELTAKGASGTALEMVPFRIR